MSPAENRDYVMRQVEQMAAVIRRLLERLRLAPGSAAAIVLDAEVARGELLGPAAEGLARVDAASAVELVRDPETVRAWADLLGIEAEARTVLGDDAVAAGLRARAESLRAALAARWRES